ncbi:MAG: hypothetical protein ACRDK4_05230 [Solirubrobacteraceae bacterium]
MAGLFLNSYPLNCSGKLKLFRLSDGTAGRRRRELQADLGVAVRVEHGNAFTYAEPANVALETIDHPLSPVDELSMFAMREALLEHCRGLGFDASVGRAGELLVSGAIPSATEDAFRIEHVLYLRVGREEFIDADAILTARHRTAWRCAEPLSDPDVAAHALRARAVRLHGDGPRRGLVLAVDGATTKLRCGPEELTVASSDYTLAVNAQVIANWRGSAVLRRVRVTTGDLTVSGKRNQHGIEDRFKLVGDAVRSLGSKITVGEGRIAIAARPVQIRVEAP